MGERERAEGEGGRETYLLLRKLFIFCNENLHFSLRNKEKIIN